MPAAPGRGVFGIPLDTQPVQGGVGVSLNLDFTAGNQASGDFGQEMASGVIDYVQSVYIDNSGNTKALSITFGGTLQNITVKPNTQGYYPVVPANGTFSWVAVSTGANVKVPVIFMNVKIPTASQWATQ